MKINEICTFSLRIEEICKIYFRFLTHHCTVWIYSLVCCKLRAHRTICNFYNFRSLFIIKLFSEAHVLITLNITDFYELKIYIIDN